MNPILVLVLAAIALVIVIAIVAKLIVLAVVLFGGVMIYFGAQRLIEGRNRAGR